MGIGNDGSFEYSQNIGDSVENVAHYPNAGAHSHDSYRHFVAGRASVLQTVWYVFALANLCLMTVPFVTVSNLNQDKGQRCCLCYLFCLICCLGYKCRRIKEIYNFLHEKAQVLKLSRMCPPHPQSLQFQIAINLSLPPDNKADDSPHQFRSIHQEILRQEKRCGAGS